MTGLGQEGYEWTIIQKSAFLVSPNIKEQQLFQINFISGINVKMVKRKEIFVFRMVFSDNFFFVFHY